MFRPSLTTRRIRCICGALLLASLAMLGDRARTGLGEQADGREQVGGGVNGRSDSKKGTERRLPLGVQEETGDESPVVVEPGRQREGTRLVDEAGTFRITGDRATFTFGDGRRQLIGLENLSLERIVRTIADDPEQVEWVVSGLLTEYQGTNYLLITRAILKTRRAERPFGAAPPTEAK